jgi:organic radical activating enzyme
LERHSRMPAEVIRIFEHSNSRPDTIHMLVTTACNLGCDGCYYADKPYGEWSLTDAMEVASQASTMGVKWLAIGGGEPLEWKPLERFVQLVRRNYPLKLAVTTNGTILRPIMVDRVHVSHDSMHCKGKSAEYRSQEVCAALDYYLCAGTAEVGINVLMEDLAYITVPMLRKINCVTVLLPKPFAPTYPEWKQVLLTRLEDLATYTTVTVDSCLATLLGQRCWQGRNSMSLDQHKQCSVCSNMKEHYAYTTLEQAWNTIRCRSQSMPKGCLMQFTS